MDKRKFSKPGQWSIEFENGRIKEIRYSASFRKLLGFDSREEFEEAQKGWEHKVHPDDWERWERTKAEIMKPCIDGPDFDLEYRIRAKDGYLWVHNYAQVLRTPDGVPVRARCIIFDISEQKHYQHLLEAQQAELRKAKEAAEAAKRYGMDYFTTTLSISPLKNADKLNEIGFRLEEEYGVKYLMADFKKKNGYKRSIELSKEYNLYRQNYCGCIYSKHE